LETRMRGTDGSANTGLRSSFSLNRRSKTNGSSGQWRLLHTLHLPRFVPEKCETMDGSRSRRSGCRADIGDLRKAHANLYEWSVNMNRTIKGFETQVSSENGYIYMMITEIGDHDGNTILAVTDGMGPNVIYGNSKCPKHLLSGTLHSHTEAVELAAKILVDGPGIYDGWRNLKAPINEADLDKKVMEAMFESQNSRLMGQGIFT
jgi:hypothetical protein